MTEELSTSDAANLDTDEPIDLSKTSRTLFQERIRKECHRPVPQLIPLNLLSTVGQVPPELENQPDQEVGQHSNRANMAIQTGRGRLARVQSYPYLFERRRLSATRKSKSDPRISVATTQRGGSTSAPVWSVNNNNERLSQLFISKSVQCPLRQGLNLEDQRLTEGSSCSENFQDMNHDVSLRSNFLAGNVRRGAGASPSTINSLRNFLQKKQRSQMPDSSSSNKTS